MGKFWKAVGATVGAALGGVITQYGPSTGLELGNDVQLLIMGILPIIGTYFAPKNKE